MAKVCSPANPAKHVSIDSLGSSSLQCLAWHSQRTRACCRGMTSVMQKCALCMHCRSEVWSWSTKWHHQALYQQTKPPLSGKSMGSSRHILSLLPWPAIASMRPLRCLHASGTSMRSQGYAQPELQADGIRRKCRQPQPPHLQILVGPLSLSRQYVGRLCARPADVLDS